MITVSKVPPTLAPPRTLSLRRPGIRKDNVLSATPRRVPSPVSRIPAPRETLHPRSICDLALSAAAT